MEQKNSDDERTPGLVTDEMVKRARAEFVDRIVDLDNPHWSERRPDYLKEACHKAGYPNPEKAADFFVRAALEAALAASFNSLREALAAIIECDDARDVFESFGLADSTDNDGQPYPSKHLADILDRARAALNGVSRYDNISENQGFKTPNVTEPEHDGGGSGKAQPSTEVEKISTDTGVRG